jgi:hypothetical protein
MPDFKGTENLYLILIFIVPGVIALSVRSKFITGRTPSTSENLLTFLVLSLIYYSSIIFLLQDAFSIQEPWIAHAAIWILLILIGPAVFGFVLGVAAQKEWFSSLVEYVVRLAARNSWFRWFAEQLDLNIVHVIPGAWDWRFSKAPRGGMFILVTLTSGERIAGYFSDNSFASSDSGERDLYIEEEYTLTSDGGWEDRPEKVGILIPMREIKYIEFWQPRTPEKANG